MLSVGSSAKDDTVPEQTADAPGEVSAGDLKACIRRLAKTLDSIKIPDGDHEFQVVSTCMLVQEARP